MFNDNGSFLLALFEFFLFFAWFMCLFWIFGDIFRSKDLGGGAKTLWVLFVIIVPWLGILMYLIVRGTACRSVSWSRPRICSGPRTSTSSPSPVVPRNRCRDQIASAKGCSTAARSPRRSSIRLKAKALAA